MAEMYKTNPSFGQRQLWSITIPGIHHSGVSEVNAFGRDYAICQRASIDEQLLGGIRFFDLRVCDDKPKAKGEIWLSHHFVSYCDFNSTIKKIADFVKSHEKEIIIVSVTHDKGRKLSEKGIVKIRQVIEEQFGSTIITNDELDEPLVRLWAKGKKIAITGTLIPNSCKKQSSWIITKSKNHKKLLNNINEYLEQHPKFEESVIHMLEAQITNRGISPPINWNAKKLNPKLPKKLRNEWSEYDINVFLHDFTNDSIIDAVISRNQ